MPTAAGHPVSYVTATCQVISALKHSKQSNIHKHCPTPFSSKPQQIIDEGDTKCALTLIGSGATLFTYS